MYRYDSDIADVPSQDRPRPRSNAREATTAENSHSSHQRPLPFPPQRHCPHRRGAAMPSADDKPPARGSLIGRVRLGLFLAAVVSFGVAAGRVARVSQFPLSLSSWPLVCLAMREIEFSGRPGGPGTLMKQKRGPPRIFRRGLRFLCAEGACTFEQGFLVRVGGMKMRFPAPSPSPKPAFPRPGRATRPATPHPV